MVSVGLFFSSRRDGSLCSEPVKILRFFPDGSGTSPVLLEKEIPAQRRCSTKLHFVHMLMLLSRLVCLVFLYS